MEAYAEFSRQLDAVEAEGHKAVLVELVSDGGESSAGLAFAGKIRSSPCTVIIQAHGSIQSAATLILASGSIREATPETVFMVHESSYKFKGNTSTLKKLVDDALLAEVHWANQMARFTKMSKREWQKLQAKTLYMNAKQALVAGLIDTIITERKPNV
jgi:ATP-dependent protease ClpP protease subunit